LHRKRQAEESHAGGKITAIAQDSAERAANKSQQQHKETFLLMPIKLKSEASADDL
jgi:hypothetical protein